MRTAAGRTLIRCRTGRTSTWGCSGVAAGRNQRNQMRPDAVAGGRDPVGVRRAPGGHDDDPRAVGLVLHLGAVDRHPLVVVVVGVEQAVPQAHVPEDALGRTAADDQSLVVGQLEGAHGVGGVAGRPAERGGRHRVGRVDGVGRAERDGHDAGLLADPRRGGPDAPGQVGVVLAVGLGRIVGLNVPGGTPSPARIVEIVAGDGGHGVGLRADPEDAGLGRGRSGR